MDTQLFAAGQIVGVAVGSLSGPRTVDRYKIVRRYAVENRPVMYHIRSLVGGGQRMVPEDELTAVIRQSSTRRESIQTGLQLFPKIAPFDRRVTT